MLEEVYAVYEEEFSVNWVKCICQNSSMKEQEREEFLQEFEQNLEKGEKLAEKQGKAFVNMTDPHGRTPVMWVCYANYNNLGGRLGLI